MEEGGRGGPCVKEGLKEGGRQRRVILGVLEILETFEMIEKEEMRREGEEKKSCFVGGGGGVVDWGGSGRSWRRV